MFDHTERLLFASAQQLQDATTGAISDGQRISAAFVAGYNGMQSVQPLYAGPLGDHPLASIVTDGAARLGLAESDATLALALLTWESYGRYQFQPAPATVEGAIAWAIRVRDAVLKLQASVAEKKQFGI